MYYHYLAMGDSIFLQHILYHNGLFDQHKLDTLLELRVLRVVITRGSALADQYIILELKMDL